MQEATRRGEEGRSAGQRKRQGETKGAKPRGGMKAGERKFATACKEIEDRVKKYYDTHQFQDLHDDEDEEEEEDMEEEGVLGELKKELNVQLNVLEEFQLLDPFMGRIYFATEE
ncbi:uncharacterized protein LOC119576493 [Penaeus monodon]|uniref:uncharacterized protein LOC119576493 n=1 Tax=Penaeus monodon TaxID=6687 RepID=UPI0018A72DD1|nr:uncharacterized protein LOC119576493 [Penaeus monodon]